MPTNFNSYSPYGGFTGGAGNPYGSNPNGIISSVQGDPNIDPVTGQPRTKIQPVPSYQNTPSQTFQNTSSNGTSLNIDLQGNAYTATGDPQMDANGKPIQYSNVTGPYQPPSTPQPPGTPPATGTGGVGFADPSYQNLVNLVNQRLTGLQTNPSFPQFDQLMNQLQSAQTSANQNASTFANQLNQRASALQQPLLSDANVVQQRALASNGLLGQRDQALANARQNLAARGINPNTSGLSLDQQNQIAQNYSNAQANIDAQLQQGNIQNDENRRNEATQLQGLAAQALQGGNLTALQEQAQAADLENQLFNLNENRANQTLGVGQIPVDLTNMGFSNSLNASNSQPNPLSQILALAGLGNQQQQIQQAGTNSNMQLLGTLFNGLTSGGSNSTLNWLLQGLGNNNNG